jgi:hypothetical protein
MNTLVDPARDKCPYDADIVPHCRRSSVQKSALAVRSRPLVPRRRKSVMRDWALTKPGLTRGDNPTEVIRRIAEDRADDKHDPAYYATQFRRPWPGYNRDFGKGDAENGRWNSAKGTRTAAPPPQYKCFCFPLFVSFRWTGKTASSDLPTSGPEHCWA